MQRFQRSLIRIVKGPAGGFVASLGIAAVLGGVALASPSQPIADLAAHHPDVIAAAPLGTDPMPVGTGMVIPRGGLQSDADPTGRGPSIHDPASGSEASSGHGPSDPATHGGQPANGLAGENASGGATHGHQDVRDDPTPGGQHASGGHGHQGGQGHAGDPQRPPVGGSNSGSGGSGGQPSNGPSGGSQEHHGPSGGSGSGSGARGEGGTGSNGEGGGSSGSSGSGGSNGSSGSSGSNASNGERGSSN
jgi:hypothetical protein